MFQYFNTYDFSNYKAVDVYKTFSLEIDTNDFTYHELTEGDNLMRISYQYYETIEDWWVIYLFNEMYDIMFDLVTNETIDTTIANYINLLENYNSLESINQKKIGELIRDFFIDDGDTLIEAITKTNDILSDVDNLDDDFLRDFKTYMNNEIIKVSKFNVKLKIPGKNVVYSMKSKMEELSVQWKNNA